MSGTAVFVLGGTAAVAAALVVAVVGFIQGRRDGRQAADRDAERMKLHAEVYAGLNALARRLGKPANYTVNMPVDQYAFGIGELLAELGRQTMQEPPPNTRLKARDGT